MGGLVGTTSSLFWLAAALCWLYVCCQKPIPHGCDLEAESKGASKCAEANFNKQYDQKMARSVVIGCITGNLTITEFRKRCTSPPLAGRVVRCIGGTLPQMRFSERVPAKVLAKFQNCIVKNIYPSAVGR
ncbi:uncharacterized protein LOC144167043 [Haemaphysalis longicornis]